jgi:hypothetical protein
MPPGSPARDGVPAHAYPAASAPVTGKLAQRDFDLGRHLGLLEGGGSPPAATGILITPADSKADWLRAGQALHRLLLHASRRVFASLHTPAAGVAAHPRRGHGPPRAAPASRRWCSKFGRGDSAAATARRPADDILTRPGQAHPQASQAIPQARRAPQSRSRYGVITSDWGIQLTRASALVLGPLVIPPICY